MKTLKVFFVKDENVMLVIYVADKLMLMQMLVLSVVERRTDQARLGPISHYRESTDRVYTDDCIFGFNRNTNVWEKLNTRLRSEGPAGNT